jgi:hypothetical protein
MWSDGNLQYRKRKRNEAKRSAPRLEGSRVAITAQQAESEYREAGFRVMDHLDLLPGISMWRFYILKKEN